MTSSVKIAEYRYVTTNDKNIGEMFGLSFDKVQKIKQKVQGDASDFLVKYNLVSDNDSFLVTFWVEIFPKNGVKSGKVSENPGKTPEVKEKSPVLGPNLGKGPNSWNRDYFSAPICSLTYRLNSFPSCAGLADSVIKIDNRPKKEPLVINVLGKSFEIGGDE